jgi:hypothetical protein
VALDNFSVFYYDFTIDTENQYLCIDEGGPEIIVELTPGSYSFEEMAQMVDTAFNAVGTLGYTVTTIRSSRKITITAPSNWTAKISSGSLGANQAWSQIGFTTSSDLTGQASYTSDSSIGSQYIPQFWLQDYVPSVHSQKAAEATVRKTATGDVEVVTFGTEKFMKCSIKYVTDIPQDGKIIRNNPSGVNDLNTFMAFLITKAKIEFMENVSDRDTFETLILEKTEQDSNGIAYELKELYAQGLPDFYEVTGLVFRVIGG